MTTGKPAPPGTARYGRAADIDGFEQLEMLWEGSITRVVKARQLSTGDIVTMKVVDATKCEEGEVDEFLAAAKSSLTLSHPNLVRVLAAGSSPDGDRAYVAQEFVDGNSLEELLEEEGKLGPSDALGVCQAIAEALAYAEDHQATHGNLKPENVMVDADGTPRLADLGVFKPVGKGDSVAVPSPHYIAPEQALNLEVDIRADLYALGIILFRLLTGKFPFTGRTLSELTNQHINQDVPDPREFDPSISDDLKSVIGWLCARDPSQRYTSARKASMDLVRLLAGRKPLGPAGEGASPRDTAALPHTLVPGVDLDAYEEEIEDDTPPAWTSSCPFKLKLSSRGVTLAEYDFDDDVVTIGRSKECAVHIDNPIVSRRHAQIRRLGTRFVVVPLSSTNATVVNGTRVHEQTDVKLGDLIVLSDKFHVDLTWDPTQAKAVKQTSPDDGTATWGGDDDDDKTPAVARKRPSGPATEPVPAYGDAEPDDGPQTTPTAPPPPYPTVEEAPNPYEAPVETALPPATEPATYRSGAPTRPTPRAGIELSPAGAGDSNVLAWGAPRGFLIFARAGAQVRSFVDKAFQVGSSHACDLRLGRDAPRKAALIVRCSDGYRLFNVGPAYDTVTLNGEPVPDHAVLEDGDELGVCGTALSFSVDTPQ